MSSLAKINPIEAALIGGNLSLLTDEQRLSYFKQICESLGLNPLTKPFEYIQLNGKLTLYARRDATDQLRKIHKVSIKVVAREVIQGVYVVTAQARLPDGREDESTGAVTIENLKGEQLANAYLKCETKAKRRVTLSICGLGILDETEVDSVPRDAASTAPEEFLLGPSKQEVDHKEYVAQVGKFKGRAIKDLDPYALDSYINFLRDGSVKNKRALSGPWLELVQHGEMYLTSIDSVHKEPEFEDFK